MGSVARISAFPQSTLKPGQTLVSELGFDSLMLVELDGRRGQGLAHASAGFRASCSARHQDLHVIAHVAGALQQKGAPQAASSDLRRRERIQSHLSAGRRGSCRCAAH